MGNIFLVDFENVHTDGLKGIKSLSEQDKVVIFYSDKDKDAVDFIIELRDDIKYAKIIKNGQNALDFQLSSYLGFCIKEANCENTVDRTHFYIVSKDVGFDCVIDFWVKSAFINDIGISPKISRAGSIHLALHPNETKPATVVKSVKITKPVKPEVLPKTADKHQQRINELMKLAKTLNEFHSLLVKEYKTKGGELYRANKAKFKELKKL